MIPRRFLSSLALIAVPFGLSVTFSTARAETPSGGSSAQPLVDEPLSDAPGKAWKVAKGKWQIVDGAWQGAELPEDKHGAVARMAINFTDAGIEFDFRLEGATGS